MKRDNETKEKLLISAKEEFMEKGYVSASLRNICKNAGVTTGALYFFYKDKEDLFGSLVNQPLNTMEELMKSHYNEEISTMSFNLDTNNNMGKDIQAAFDIVDYLYEYNDEFKLLITKSQGSCYENCIDRFIEITEKHYRIFADRLSEELNVPTIDDYIIHWISHMQISSFAEIIAHDLTKEEAKKHIYIIANYLMGGWCSMFTSSRK